MKRALCLLAAVAFGLVAAGCGGGGGDSSATPISAATTTEPSLTKDEFIQQGDAICAEVNSAIDSLSSSGSSSTSSSDQEAQLYSGMVERLKALGTPDDDQGLTDVFNAADALVSAAENGDTAAISSALSSFKTAADDYGFKDCGQGTTSSIGTGTAAGTAGPGTATTPVAPAAPAPTTVTPAPPAAPAPGATGAGGGTAGTGGGTAGTGGGGGTSGSGGVGPG